MFKHIETSALTTSDLPRKFASWDKIVKFASTFDLMSESEEPSNVTGLNDLMSESTITDIRAALYSEWRRYNHRSDSPDSELMKIAWLQIEKIREILNNDA